MRRTVIRRDLVAGNSGANSRMGSQGQSSRPYRRKAAPTCLGRRRTGTGARCLRHLRPAARSGGRPVAAVDPHAPPRTDDANVTNRTRYLARAV